MSFRKRDSQTSPIFQVKFAIPEFLSPISNSDFREFLIPNQREPFFYLIIVPHSSFLSLFRFRRSPFYVFHSSPHFSVPRFLFPVFVFCASFSLSCFPFSAFCFSPFLSMLFFSFLCLQVKLLMSLK